MKYSLVGVKVLKDSFDRSKKPAKPMRFCEMVAQALVGKEFIAEISDLSCPSAELCLGYREPRYVDIEPRIKPAETKAVYVGRADNADVILLVLNPEQMMTLSILLGGVSANFRGEFGVCGEAVARVYTERKPNLSFFCNGARMFADFKGNEVILGIPYDAMIKISESITKIMKTGGALCGCQVSDIPSEIVQNIRECGLEKGADYFFGKVEDQQVRIYLNKDETGRFKYITFHFPVKDKEVRPKYPFEVRKRENWSDIHATFEPESLGIDLYTGEKLAETIRDITRKAYALVK
jgi:uncharacterized protein (DUF169 family)